MRLFESTGKHVIVWKRRKTCPQGQLLTSVQVIPLDPLKSIACAVIEADK